MHDRNIDISALDAAAHELTLQAQTPMFIAVGGTAAGLISVPDAIKPDSMAAIKSLHDIGL